MAISLGDVKRNRIKVKKLEETNANPIQENQTINLRDISSGRIKMQPLNIKKEETTVQTIILLKKKIKHLINEKLNYKTREKKSYLLILEN